MFSTIAEYFDNTRRAACVRGHTTNLECTKSLVERYIGWFTGACFDPRMDEPWWQGDRFNSSDLYGVAALSMAHMIATQKLDAFCEVFDRDDAAASASSCSSACVSHQTCILMQIPTTATVWDPSAAHYIELANKLWMMLYKTRPKGVGETGVNKLVTHKRPHLLPVVDDVSRERMRLSNGKHKPKDHWKYFHGELNPMPAGLRDAIGEVRTAAGVPEWTADIRIIDIAIWMEHKHHC